MVSVFVFIMNSDVSVENANTLIDWNNFFGLKD